MEDVTRLEDMSVRGRLTLSWQDDGDICITVIEDSGRSAGIEFCNTGGGGGQSPNTLRALRELYKAMQKDNQDNPITRG